MVEKPRVATVRYRPPEPLLEPVQLEQTPVLQSGFLRAKRAYAACSRSACTEKGFPVNRPPSSC